MLKWLKPEDETKNSANGKNCKCKDVQIAARISKFCTYWHASEINAELTKC